MTWPDNDPILMLVAKHLGVELAFEKLERHAIVCAEPDVRLRQARFVGGGWSYGEALREWRPEREMMPIQGHSA